MQFQQIPKDQLRIPGENYYHTLTPYFRYETVVDVPASERENQLKTKLVEVVEVRMAANPQYRPVFPVDAMYRKDGIRVVTWAERFSTQYQQFLAGATQEAEGTPLEELKPYGITPAQLSICRAMNIYSIEALYHLEGPGLKRLGLHGNELKPMAKRYMEARQDGSQQAREIAELRAELERLKSGEGLSIDVPQNVPELPEGFEAMDDDALKSAIADKVGARPRGNPSRETLVRMAIDAGIMEGTE